MEGGGARSRIQRIRRTSREDHRYAARGAGKKAKWGKGFGHTHCSTSCRKLLAFSSRMPWMV